MLKGSSQVYFDVCRGAALRQAGATFGEIARSTGVSRYIATRLLRAAGVEPAALSRPPVRSDAADVLERVGVSLDAGVAYRQIAHDMGLTVGQVAGIAHRHFRANERRQGAVRPGKSGLTTRGDTPRRVRASRKVVADTPKPPTPAAQAVRAVPVPVPAEASLVACAPVALVLAGPGVCRWPLWSATDGLEQMEVCGAACGRGSYCAGHAALAYQPPKARRAA